MRGRIVQRGRKWRLQIHLGRTADGKRRYHYSTHDTQEAAEAARAAWNSTQQAALSQELTINRLLDLWLREHVAAECTLRTEEGYHECATRLRPRIGDRLASDVIPSDLLRLYAALKQCGGAGGGALSATTVLHTHRALSAAYAHSVALGRLGNNPCRQIPRGKVPSPSKRRPKALTKDQLSSLLDAVRDTPVYAIVALAAVTGLRRGELCALQWSDVDLDVHTLTVRRSIEQVRGLSIRLKEPKTSDSIRTIRLSRAAVGVLRAERVRVAELALSGGGGVLDTLPVFPTRDLAHRVPTGLSKQIARACRAAGIEPVGLHALRHTHATQLLASRLSPKVVAERLGHADVTTTLSVYAHVLREQEDDVVEILDQTIQL